MLPFLKPKAVAGVIISRRKPDGNTEVEGMEGQENDNSGLNMCAADLIRAIHAKDEEGVSSALKSAFELLDSEPHEEGPHMDEQSGEE